MKQSKKTAIRKTRNEERQAVKKESLNEPDLDVLNLNGATLVGAARFWFQARGYRALEICTFQGGILYAKGDEVPKMLCFGETMRWDGERMILGG